MPRRKTVANPPPTGKHERLSRYAARGGSAATDVEAMSEDSFPASDPPGFAPTRIGRPPRPDERRPVVHPSTVTTPELRFPCDDEVKFEVVEQVKRNLRAGGADVNDIDGVRVTTPDGWWLLRASNTQACWWRAAKPRTRRGLLAAGRASHDGKSIA